MQPIPPAQTPSPSQPSAQETSQTRSEATHLDQEPASRAIHPEMRPHAFVIMPFGKKKGADGSLYDFNAVYSQLIKPALESAGFEPFRADEETTSGDILTDMFQELLLADLCIADMSIDNANVFYELGVRHAFRKRGVVHIQAGRGYMPFDVFNVRTIPYHITPEGVPDPATLEKDKATITRVTRDTWTSDLDSIHSPIFNLLDGLTEPNRMALKTPLATGFWREYDEWRERLRVAQRQKRIGDILLLTEEIRNPLIKEDAIGEAALALRNMGRYELALTQYRKGLEVNGRNPFFRREEAFNLNRLGKVDEAIVKIESLLADTPRDTETIAYLGRIYKEMWVNSWKWIDDRDLRIRTAFESYHWLLISFQTYLRGYQLDLNEFYPAINALTLGTILVHLADQFEDKAQPDPEIQEVRRLLGELRSSLNFALESRTRAENADYWAFISLGELLVLTAKAPHQVSRAYRKALTAARASQFRLQSSLTQLEMLRSLDLRREFVEAGIDVINEELMRIRRDVWGEEPAVNQVVSSLPEREGTVFLFTGPIFKEGQDNEEEIRLTITTVLEKYNAGPDDLAITAGMDAGGEILFVECCVERGVPVQVYFPLLEGPYVKEFLIPGGERWVERFYSLRNHPHVYEFYQPECVGLPRESDNVHERNNRWALYSALGRGIDKVRLIALRDDKSDPKSLDARLVKHMVDLMREIGGIVEHVVPTSLTTLGREKLTANGRTVKKNTSRKKR